MTTDIFILVTFSFEFCFFQAGLTIYTTTHSTLLPNLQYYQPHDFWIILIDNLLSSLWNFFYFVFKIFTCYTNNKIFTCFINNCKNSQARDADNPACCWWKNLSALKNKTLLHFLIATALRSSINLNFKTKFD